MARQLVIYSGRNRPDLSPIYRLYEQLSGTAVRVEKVYHQDVRERLLAERDEPQADVVLTNSQLALEELRGSEVFESYEAPVARAYDPWLRAEDYGWLSFTAWPRVAMVNRSNLGNDAARWPRRLEELTEPQYRNAVACASLVEMTTVAQFATLRVSRGEDFTRGLIAGLRANGLRVYSSNKDTREALGRESLALALANSSNVHVFYLEGNAVGESWLDQADGEMGTVIEAHTVAILRGARHPDEARRFIDFLLSAETQGLLARLYGETPVNAEAEHGAVKRLADIRRMAAPISDVLSVMPSTLELLRAEGFEVLDDDG